MEDCCRSLETKLTELTRTASSASPRLSNVSNSSDASVDPLLAVLSWPSPPERASANVLLRSSLGPFSCHVLIFRKHSTMALLKAKIADAVRTIIDASKEGR